MHRSLVISFGSHIVIVILTVLSLPFIAKKGKLKVASITNTKWTDDEAIIFLYTHYLSLYGSEIKATLVKPEPDNIPIISRTLP